MLDAIMSAPDWAWMLASVVLALLVWVAVAHKEMRAWWNSLKSENYWETKRREALKSSENE